MREFMCFGIGFFFIVLGLRLISFPEINITKGGTTTNINKTE